MIYMTLKDIVMGSNRKNISIDEKTHHELAKLGVYGETMDDIIKKCIEAYKKVNKTNE
jgi:hypothetical protein